MGRWAQRRRRASDPFTPGSGLLPAPADGAWHADTNGDALALLAIWDSSLVLAPYFTAEYKLASDSVWLAFGTPAATTTPTNVQASVTGLVDGDYNVRVRYCVNSAGDGQGDPSNPLTVTLGG
jgi:hypothetical protein